MFPELFRQIKNRKWSKTLPGNPRSWRWWCPISYHLRWPSWHEITIHLYSWNDETSWQIKTVSGIRMWMWDIYLLWINALLLCNPGLPDSQSSWLHVCQWCLEVRRWAAKVWATPGNLSRWNPCPWNSMVPDSNPGISLNFNLPGSFVLAENLLQIENIILGAEMIPRRRALWITSP